MHGCPRCSRPGCLGPPQRVSDTVIGVGEPSHLLTKHDDVISRMMADGKNMHAVCLIAKHCPQRLAQAPIRPERDAGPSIYRPLRRLIHHEPQLIICAPR